MAIEQMRSCGYRQVGGLYICGGGKPRHCDRLPYPLNLCPVCGSGIKFTRGWTWLDWHQYAGEHEHCACTPHCPICRPQYYMLAGEKRYGKYGLLWVGGATYTPESFSREAEVMGVSRRIPAIPRGLKLGKTVVLLAHKDTLVDGEPGIFEAFVPTSLEYLIWESEATKEKIAELRKRHITPIVIPDGDEDHDPDIKKTTTETKTTRRLSELRNRLKSHGPVFKPEGPGG